MNLTSNNLICVCVCEYIPCYKYPCDECWTNELRATDHNLRRIKLQLLVLCAQPMRSIIRLVRPKPQVSALFKKNRLKTQSFLWLTQRKSSWLQHRQWRSHHYCLLTFKNGGLWGTYRVQHTGQLPSHSTTLINRTPPEQKRVEADISVHYIGALRPWGAETDRFITNRGRDTWLPPSRD